MPLELVLADIKKKLGAARVFLPGPIDITPHKDKPEERNDLDPSFQLPWERASLVDRLRRMNDLDHTLDMLDPWAELQATESLAMPSSRSSTRSRSVGSRPLESQDVLRSTIHMPWDIPNPSLPVIQSSYLAGHWGPPSTRSTRYQETGPQRHYSRAEYEGDGVHRDMYSRPPVVVTRRPSSRRLESSNFGMPRYGDVGAELPPPQQYYGLHGQTITQLGSRPRHQTIEMIAGYIPANVPHMGLMAYPMTMGKNGTDSGYASRTSSHQASPIPSPPQPSTAAAAAAAEPQREDDIGRFF